MPTKDTLQCPPNCRIYSVGEGFANNKSPSLTMNDVLCDMEAVMIGVWAGV